MEYQADTKLVQSAFEEAWNKVEMERKRIYCIRRGFVSESDRVVKALSFEGLPGPPKLPKVVTGKYLFSFKGNLWKM